MLLDDQLGFERLQSCMQHMEKVIETKISCTTKVNTSYEAHDKYEREINALTPSLPSKLTNHFNIGILMVCTNGAMGADTRASCSRTVDMFAKPMQEMHGTSLAELEA